MMELLCRITRLLSLLVLPASCLATLNCRPDGPIVPKPIITHLESSQILSSAAVRLTSMLEDGLSGSIEAGWDTRNASFSLALVSADQEDPAVPLWEYHHLAEANTNGTTDLDRHSQYLIGSVSKLVSDYVLMQTGIDLHKPIVNFLPELANSESKVPWADITLQMLANHLAGIPTNYGFSEYYDLKQMFISMGLPHIDDSQYPSCGIAGLNNACTGQEILSGMKDVYPVTTVNERPAYSNLAFTLMFMAVEAATGKNYTQLVSEYFSIPLNLTNTFPSPGENSKAVIPPGDSSWGGDYGYNAPAGGLVSSLSDLTKFAHAILSRRIPMTESQVRGWMKPSSFTGGPSSFVGMPWEIYRPRDLTPDHPHDITVYSKSGGAVGYRAQWSLIDELGIGVVVLAAGPTEAMPLLHGTMIKEFVPAIDRLARQSAEMSLARTFTSGNGKGAGISSPITATISQDKDSLILKNLTRGDFDIAESLLGIFSLTVGSFGFPVVPPMRIFPSGVKEQSALKDGTKVEREAWRIWPDLKTTSDSDLSGADYENDNCMSWTFGDWVYYGGEPLDRLLFYRDMNGEVVGIEVPFLRSGLLTSK